MPPVLIDPRRADDPRDVVHRAVQALAEGKVVAFPTETIYGVAASALDEQAVAKLASIKGRDPRHPFTLAVRGAEEALDFIPDMPPLARRLARRCWPGPLTMVLADNHPDSAVRRLPDSVRAQVLTAEQTVGLRVPAHELVLAVMRLIAGPLVLTSANRSGLPPATTAAEVIEALGDDVQLVVDDGPCRFGQPSTVARIDDDIQVLREGVFNEPTLRRLAGLMIVLVCTGNTCRSPMAAGLVRHRLAQRLGCRVDELEDRGVMILSAGVAAMSGDRASSAAVEVLAAKGIDIRDHESQPLTERIVRFADLVLTMTRGHRDAVWAQWPESAERVHLLCHSGADVSDPIGGPLEVYAHCASQIEAQVDAWIDRIDLAHLVPLRHQ